MSTRNRTAGHSFELECARLFREAGFSHVVTTRSESRSRDNQQIDLINKDEGTNGRLPYNVQCKNKTTKVVYHKILSELPKTPNVVNVVIHKQTEKTAKSGRFLPVGKYAILNLEDFMNIVKKLNESTVTRG